MARGLVQRRGLELPVLPGPGVALPALRGRGVHRGLRGEAVLQPQPRPLGRRGKSRRRRRLFRSRVFRSRFFTETRVTHQRKPVRKGRNIHQHLGVQQQGGALGGFFYSGRGRFFGATGTLFRSAQWETNRKAKTGPKRPSA